MKSFDSCLEGKVTGFGAAKKKTRWLSVSHLLKLATKLFFFFLKSECIFVRHYEQKSGLLS